MNTKILDPTPLVVPNLYHKLYPCADIAAMLCYSSVSSSFRNRFVLEQAGKP